VAWVSTAGSIDIACFPQLNSPTIFAGLLALSAAGSSTLPRKASPCAWSMYLPDTNVLMTRFYTAHGIVEIMYFMPLTEGGQASDFRIVRHLNVTKGAMRVSLRCARCFDYARIAHRLEIIHSSARFAPEDGGPALQLTVK
jgi:GH15 family glucan-1,4-alpha-glucosidase